jgi:hypothetical protein
MTISSTPTAIASFSIQGDSNVIVEQIDAVYTLRWNDGVANEWTESYPTLSVALARAATLAACGESDWEKGFANSPVDFTVNAKNFLVGEVA